VLQCNPDIVTNIEVKRMLAHSAIKNAKGISRTATFAIVGGGFALGFVVFFRAQIFSRFDLLFGDRGDARFVLFIHEHVFRAMLGQSSFLSPPFFYDVTKTLGFSDAFLLNQLIYAPLRVLGADPYLALLLTIMILSVAGYGFLYALLRKFGQASVATAIFSSILFTFANNLYVNANHLQLFAIYYVPLVAYLAVYAITNVHKNKNRSLVAGGFAGFLYGLLFSTAFYMAWFFGLALLIFTPIFVFQAWHTVRTWFLTDPIRIGAIAIVFLDGFVIGIIPFGLIYGPLLKSASARDFGEYLFFAPAFSDIANLGANFVWADLLNKIGLVFNDWSIAGGEKSFALTPILQIFTISSLLIGLRKRYWGAGNHSELMRAIVIVAAIVPIALFFVTIKIHNYSAFLILTKIVPGAVGIRSGYRAMIVANFFAVISVAFAIDRVLPMLSQYSAAGLAVKLARGSIVALMIISLVEQVNLRHGSLVSRAFERAHFNHVSGAPNDCRSFYIAPEPGQPPAIVQIDAMLVAQKVGIPTINGYSSNVPFGWELLDTADAIYEQYARAWAARRGIEAGLCRFDMGKATFARVD
jgi:hypothetical protein